MLDGVDYGAGFWDLTAGSARHGQALGTWSTDRLRAAGMLDVAILVEIRAKVVNQLRANLELAMPGAIGLFSKPDSPIMLAFLRRSADNVAWRPSRSSAAPTTANNRSAWPDGTEEDARWLITLGLVAALEALSNQIKVGPCCPLGVGDLCP